MPSDLDRTQPFLGIQACANTICMSLIPAPATGIRGVKVFWDEFNDKNTSFFNVCILSPREQLKLLIKCTKAAKNDEFLEIKFK